MPFFILSIIIQVLFIIHIVKTGRNTTWIWIVLILPIAGAIAHFIIEILPELVGGRTARKAKKELSTMINPNKDMREASMQYAMADTVDNTLKLAEAHIEKKSVPRS